MKFKSDIEVQAGIKDYAGSSGTAGQVLSSDGATVTWIDADVGVASDVQNEVKAGVAINKGQAVYVTSADGTNIIVGLASNTSEATSSKTLGLLNATVAANGMADVVQIGRLSGLNTIGAVVGDPVWLGTNGNLIYGLANKPYAPAHLVYIGVVTRVNANNGEIFITVQNGFELQELHNVDIITTPPVNGDVLGYNGSLWVNKTIPGWLGYTPVPTTRTITINGVTQDLAANQTWTVAGGIDGSGTANYISKFVDVDTIGNSPIFDLNGNIGIGTITPTAYSGFINLSVGGSSRGIVSVRNNANNEVGYLYNQFGDVLTLESVLSDLKLTSAVNKDIIFSTSGANERLRISATGTVAINNLAGTGTRLVTADANGVLSTTTDGAVTTYNSTLTLNTSWQNTGIDSSVITTSGVYLVTCFANDFGTGGGQYSSTYVGTMYFYAGGTNGVNANEIPLHHSSHADQGRYIYLRTLSSLGAGDGKLYLQIKGNGTNTSSSTYVFTFKKLL